MAGNASAGLAIAGGILGAYGQYRQGKLAARVGKMRRRLLESSAEESVAIGQRKALAEQKNARLLASRALAVAAAGGGGADDPTVEKIITDIEGEGAYRAAVEMYNGEEEARQKRYQGQIEEWEGKTQQSMSRLSALGTLVGSGGSMYKNYR